MRVLMGGGARWGAPGCHGVQGAPSKRGWVWATALLCLGCKGSVCFMGFFVTAVHGHGAGGELGCCAPASGTPTAPRARDEHILNILIDIHTIYIKKMAVWDFGHPMKEILQKPARSSNALMKTPWGKCLLKVLRNARDPQQGRGTAVLGRCTWNWLRLEGQVHFL